MRTHRFGRRIKLPSTIAIKHQIRTLMARDEIARAEADARLKHLADHPPGERELPVK
jgi:hypothetical protein